MPDRKRTERTEEEPAHNGPGSSSGAAGGGPGHSNRRPLAAILIKLAGTVAVLAGAALLASTATWSNLNATATNPSNSFSTGTVALSSNSPSSAVLSLSSAKPGEVSTGCIRITYTGTLPAELKLYGTGAGTGLNQYLKLVLTRGSFSGTPASGSCTGFTADTTNYISQGAGIIYSGTLAALPSSAATALEDPTSANPATWTAQTTRGYQFHVTMLSNAAAQGLNGQETFTFEADSI
jgi:hypothetical protein